MESILETIGLIRPTDKLLSQVMIDKSEKSTEYLDALSSPAVIDQRQIVAVEYPVTPNGRLMREVWSFDQSSAQQIDVVIDSKLDPVGIVRQTHKWRILDLEINDPARAVLEELTYKLFDMSEEISSTQDDYPNSHKVSEKTKKLFARSYQPHESNYTLCFLDDKKHESKFTFRLSSEESLDDLLKKWERFCQQNYIYPDAVLEIYVGEN